MGVSFWNVAQPAEKIEISTELVGNTPYKMRNRAKEKSPENVVFSRLPDGGDEGDRTPDLLNAIQARSQLRHAPRCCLYIQFLNAIRLV